MVPEFIKSFSFPEAQDCSCLNLPGYFYRIGSAGDSKSLFFTSSSGSK